MYLLIWQGGSKVMQENWVFVIIINTGASYFPIKFFLIFKYTG